jgi:hypothetical protein
MQWRIEVITNNVIMDTDILLSRLGTDNSYEADVDESIKQLWSREWLYQHSEMGDYLRDIFPSELPEQLDPFCWRAALGMTNKKQSNAIKQEQHRLLQPENISIDDLPYIYDEICSFCQRDICTCSQECIQPNMWNGLIFSTADHVMIKTESLGKNLEFDACMFTFGHRGLAVTDRRGIGAFMMKHLPTPDRQISFLAVSHVASEDWFRGSYSVRLCNRIRAAAEHVNATHVWIDSICLPIRDKLSQLKTMGALYSAAVAVCVISDDVISTGSMEMLWSSKWMKRAWTLQEGYNATQLLTITSLERNTIAIAVNKHNLPENVRHLIMRKVPVSVCEAIALLQGRDMANRDEVSYVIASLIGNRNVGIMGVGSTLGNKSLQKFLIVGALMLGIVATMLFRLVVRLIDDKDKEEKKEAIFQITAFTLATLIVILLFRYIAYVIQLIMDAIHVPIMEWMDMDKVLKSSHRIGTSVLLMSPDPAFLSDRCWYPGVLRQNSVEAAAVLSMCFSDPEIMPADPQDGKFDDRGMIVRGKLLDRLQTLVFLEECSNISKWVWIRDAETSIVNATNDESIRVFVCVHETTGFLPWTSFGFVTVRDKTLHRTERFWILPISRTISHHCGKVLKENKAKDHRIR